MKTTKMVRRVTPILNVSDVPASIAWFESLGWECSFCWNSGGGMEEGERSNEHGPADFAGVCSNHAEIFLCLDGQGSRPGPIPAGVGPHEVGGAWMSWWLGSPADVDAMYSLALDKGYAVPEKPFDAPWGVREFLLRHPDGHTIRVGAGLESE
jgi:hypothetical protein